MEYLYQETIQSLPVQFTLKEHTLLIIVEECCPVVSVASHSYLKHIYIHEKWTAMW